MSLISILETLLIGPLKLIFEIIFGVANKFIGHPGLAIIVLSLIMNILVLPLYRRADAMQEEARDMEAKLHDGAAHIRKTFSGDERMMILQTYYRQNHYKPTDALNGSVSLLLEIPFFMAAYQFLSHLEILNGVSLGPIQDLGAPDQLLVIGGFAINVLPILMTLINVISSALYLKGFPLKTKIQLYGMALFFLVFLYTSPSCLVFYWTLNNLFSLVKTIFYKLKNPQKVLRFLMSVAGLLFFGFGFADPTDQIDRKAFLFAVGVLLQLPLLLHLLKGKVSVSIRRRTPQPNRKLFIWGGLFLTILVGALIPSTFLAASPQEFIDITYFHHPLWYMVSALCLAAGTFLVWLGVFYWLASPRGKAIFDKLVWVLCGVMLVNYMFFGTNLGVISSVLQYENGLVFSVWEQLLNVVILIALAVLMVICATRWKRVTATVLMVATVALGGMSVLNAVTIQGSVEQLSIEDQPEDESKPHFQLSKKGKNVVVLMLDRAMGEYIPYLFQEKPQLKEQFAGFTYYKNTISFGGYTNFGVPALLGGYEYTPVELNKRIGEKLVDKHNEALKVMPVLFSEQGFDVTVCDPVYANYQWVPDLSIFDEYPEIDAYISKGEFGDVSQKISVIENNYRNFFCFSIMKSMPLVFQPAVYNHGQYNQVASTAGSVASGTYISFLESYSVLNSMPYMTRVTEEDTNTFMFMSNDMTHEPIMLQTPDYTPSHHPDNGDYDAANPDRFVIDGKELKVETELQMQHYHINMAAMLQLGEWFDYLREEGVYDNTRIILVADHGRNMAQLEELVMDDGSDPMKNVEMYFPLFMVKDFNSAEFTVSEEFMTNADVPTLAVKDLIQDPKNPFTGKPINDKEKTAHDQFVILSDEFRINVNNGTTFKPSKWASVKENLWEKENWTFNKGNIVLREHDFK